MHRTVSNGRAEKWNIGLGIYRLPRSTNVRFFFEKSLKKGPFLDPLKDATRARAPAWPIGIFWGENVIFLIKLGFLSIKLDFIKKN